MSVISTLRVRYAETDQMQVVYHANYLVWFEIGRTDLLRAAGLTYERLEKECGRMLPVAEARCRYKNSARYDDRIEIETRTALVHGALIKFAYRVYRIEDEEGKDKTLLAEGETTHVVCDLAMKRASLPPEYAAALKAGERG